MVTCTVGGHHIAIHVSAVREVIRHSPVTPVPGCLPTLKGLINLRGHIYTILDLAKCFSDEYALPEKERKIVVLRQFNVKSGNGNNELRQEQCGLLVDAIGDIAFVEDERIAPPPANLPAGALPFINAVTELEGKLHAIADVPQLLAWDGIYGKHQA